MTFFFLSKMLGGRSWIAKGGNFEDVRWNVLFGIMAKSRDGLGLLQSRLHTSVLSKSVMFVYCESPCLDVLFMLCVAQ